MSKITAIHARQILDSRGNPTIEADVILETGVMGRAAVPSGASTGIHEALELRDKNSSLYLGKSVMIAVENVNSEIAHAIVGMDVTDQEGVDHKLITLDGTPNKSRIGANAILSVSLAVAHAAANNAKLPLFQYLNPEATLLPLPMMNVINGGKHAAWAADIQEFIIFPVGASSFSHALQMGAEVFQTLANVLTEKGYSTAVGDEGGFAPLVKHGNAEALDLISQAVEKAGYKVGQDIVFGLDAAASEFYKDGIYHLKTEGKELTTAQMVEWLVDLKQQFPIVSMEDCLDQEDWEGWKLLTEKLGGNTQIVGDDLFVTNTSFLARGIKEKSANAILIKVNQIGTLTETKEAIEMAKKSGWHSIISHRSGETEDTTIAHLAVGFATGQIKTGSLSRSDRVAKYNELLRIEEVLGDKAQFAGSKALSQ